MSTESNQQSRPHMPFQEFQALGLLWLVNRVVFHPRGYALTFHVDEDGTIKGWSMQGDGSEPWSFTEADDDEMFKAIKDSKILG